MKLIKLLYILRLYSFCIYLIDKKGFNINISSEYYKNGINWLFQIYWYKPYGEWEISIGRNGQLWHITAGTMLYGDNGEYPTRKLAEKAAIEHYFSISDTKVGDIKLIQEYL